MSNLCSVYHDYDGHDISQITDDVYERRIHRYLSFFMKYITKKAE